MEPGGVIAEGPRQLLARAGSAVVDLADRLGTAGTAAPGGNRGAVRVAAAAAT